MLLVNYKNECTTNVSEYYMLAIYIANSKHLFTNLCRTVFCSFLRLQNFWKIYGCMPIAQLL